MTAADRDTLLVLMMPVVERVSRQIEWRVRGRVPAADLAQEAYVHLIAERVIETFDPATHQLDAVIAFQARRAMFGFLRSRRGGQVVQPSRGEHVGHEVELSNEVTDKLYSQTPTPLEWAAIKQKWERLTELQRQMLILPTPPHRHRVPGRTRSEKRAYDQAQMSAEELAVRRAREAERVRLYRQRKAA